MHICHPDNSHLYREDRMHTLANKVSARDRELAPKYYYKREHTTTWLQKTQNAARVFISFMFTQVPWLLLHLGSPPQVGVIVLIGLYMVLGAVVFQSVEADSLMNVALVAQQVGNRR